MFGVEQRHVGSAAGVGEDDDDDDFDLDLTYLPADTKPPTSRTKPKHNIDVKALAEADRQTLDAASRIFAYAPQSATLEEWRRPQITSNTSN